MMVMSSSCFTLRINRMLFFVSTILLAMALARPTGLTPAQERTLLENGNAKLSVAYARACLKLAEAELDEAEEQNRRSKKSVTDYDLKRLQLHVRFAQQNFSIAEQGGDYGQSIVGYIKMQSHLAELDLKTSEELHQKYASPATEVQLERIRRYAEVCRLRLELIRDPVSALEIVDHLHWETHRLSEEMLLLNRRVERLEETAMR
jgi:hypothetical protein